MNSMLKNQLITSANQLGGTCAFVVANLNTGETIVHEENRLLPSASLIKVPILLEVLRRVKEGSLSLSQRFSVKPEDKKAYSVLEFLDCAQTFSLRDLLNLMIVYSDNTATNVLIHEVGMDSVNQFLRAEGYNKTTLNRCMMDFLAREQGRENVTTASEMAGMLHRLYEGSLLGAEYDSLALTILCGQADECMMRVDLPDEVKIARKSGELESLNHEMAIVYTEKTDYLYVFFAYGTASNNESREILQHTSKMVWDYFTK